MPAKRSPVKRARSLGRDTRLSEYDRIYAIVRRIPRGKVATYGQIAQLVGLGRAARRVGYALSALRGQSPLPWHRVINASGGSSLPPLEGGITQRLKLEQEGVTFDAGGRVDLEKYRWRPRR
jgi:methylated-DNA-protein-cysteine methyltransferase-like protein